MGWMGWMGWVGLDLCAGLFYEHRFAMLIILAGVGVFEQVLLTHKR